MKYRKKNLLKLFLSFMVLFSFVSVSGKVFADSPEENQDNPYLEKYLIEKENEDTPQPDDEDIVVDPEVEDQIIQDTLTDYYDADVKVGDLLVSLTGDESIYDQTVTLDSENRIKTMHKIIELYPTVNNQTEKELLSDYVNRYSLNSNDTQSIEFINEIRETIDGPDVSAFALYNGTAAGSWAYDNYNKYSKNYPKFTGDFGTDCTNFVSQAMLAGGKTKSGSWTISKKNDKYWVINSGDQLNYSWKLTDQSPWVSVKQFRSYWSSKATVRGYLNDNYIKNHSKIYNTSISKGDVIILHKGVLGITMPTHAMIISSYDTSKKDFKMAGHSVERQAKPLLEIMPAYTYVEFFEF